MAEESNNLIAPNDKPSKEERHKDLKQFEGTKGVKKQGDGPFISWLRAMFFSGKTVKEIIKDVAENNAVPWLKDGLYNMITSLASQFIYRDHKSIPGSGNAANPSGNFVNYVTYSEKKKQQEKAAEQSQKNDDAVIRAGFEHPAFSNDPPGTPKGKTALQKAREFLDEMHRYVTKYGSMSVEDLGWMRGKTVSYVWEKYGWTKEEILGIKEPTHVSNPDTPYIILMPEAHPGYDNL